MSAGSSTSNLFTPRTSLSRRLAAGSVASAATFGVTVIQSLLMVPLLLSAWSPEVYDRWILVTCVYGLLTTFDAGLHNYVGNLLAMEGGAGLETIRRTLGAGVRAACLTAIFLSCVSLGVITLPRMARAFGLISNSDDHTTRMALGLLVGYWCALGSVGGVVVRLYPAGGRLARSLWMSLGQRVAMSISLVAAAWAGAGLVGGAVAWIAAGATFAGLILVDCRRAFPSCWPWWESGTWKQAVGLIGRSTGLVAVSLLDALTLTAVLALTEKWATAGGITMFGTMRTATNVIMQASGVFLTPLAPDISRVAAANDSARVSAITAAAWLFVTGPIALAVTVGMPFAETIYTVWTRNRVAFSSCLFLSLAAAVLIRQWSTPLALLFYCTNQIRSQFMISLFRSITTLAAIAAAFPTFGIGAMGLGTLAGEIAGVLVSLLLLGFATTWTLDRRCIASSVLALAQVAVPVLVGVGMTLLPPPRWHLAALAILLQCGLLAMQWSCIHEETRTRISLLLRRLS